VIPTNFTIVGNTADGKRFSVQPDGVLEAVRGSCMGNYRLGRNGAIRVKINGYTPTNGRMFVLQGKTLSVNVA